MGLGEGKGAGKSCSSADPRHTRRGMCGESMRSWVERVWAVILAPGSSARGCWDEVPMRARALLPRCRRLRFQSYPPDLTALLLWLAGCRSTAAAEGGQREARPQPARPPSCASCCAEAAGWKRR